MLIFVKTLTVAEFKQQNCIECIEIIRNPNSDKLFFVAGEIKGAVTAYEGNVRMSLVEGDNGDFWLLHAVKNDNVVMVL